jgi:hypothetical protein
MDRLQLQHRRLGGLLVVLFALVSGATACSDDLVEVPEYLRGEPACAWLIDTRVHFADGGHRLISDEQTRYTGAACLCVTEEEFESRSRDDEFNDLALDLCHELATQYDFVWSECQMNYESERWLDFVFWARGEFDHPSAHKLGCVGE